MNTLNNIQLYLIRPIVADHPPESQSGGEPSETRSRRPARLLTRQATLHSRSACARRQKRIGHCRCRSSSRPPSRSHDCQLGWRGRCRLGEWCSWSQDRLKSSPTAWQQVSLHGEQHPTTRGRSLARARRESSALLSWTYPTRRGALRSVVSDTSIVGTYRQRAYQPWSTVTLGHRA